jgi:uncharacterized protein
MLKRTLTSILFATTLSISFLSIANNAFEEGSKAAANGDYQDAIKIWMPLAKNNDATAQNNIGVLYENGWGFTQDYSKAILWYRKAAEQGQIDAQHNLATMYQQGNGVEKDLNIAGQWFEKAAIKGKGEAQIILGILYQEIEDFEHAAYWYDKAVKQNVEGAQKNMDYLCMLNSIDIKSFCQK